MPDDQHTKDKPLRLVEDRDPLGIDEDREDVDLDLEPWENDQLADTYREETAAEVAPPLSRPTQSEVDEREDDDITSGRGIGIFAVILSVLALFFLPVLLGAAGIVVGFISRGTGSKTLGNWAIGIGAVSIILTVFFSPFF